MITVSIVVPTRNEQKTISSVYWGIKANVKLPHEIIVVDDSTDNTPEVARKLGCKVVKGQGCGLGQAILDGIHEASGKIIVVMDADCSHSPSSIPDLIRPIMANGCQMTVGSRYTKYGRIEGWNLKRRLISLVASWLAYPLTGIRDNTSGFFAIRRELVANNHLKPTSWKMMLEILIKTKPHNVQEVPIVFRDRYAGKSKFNNKEVIAYGKHLVILAFERFRILNFMLVGGLGYVVNMAVYWGLLQLAWQNETVLFGQHFYLPPFLISSLIAISSNYELNKHWTFRGWHEHQVGGLRYFVMAIATLVLDMFMLFMLVDYAGFTPMLSAALAILIVFVVRYFIAKTWVWTKQ